MLSVCLIAFVAGCSKTTPNVANTSPGSPVGHTAPGPAEAQAPHPIVTPSNDASGKVISVNQKARYAVLSYGIGAVPAVGSRLFAYRNGLKVGELRVSGPQRENNTIADLVTGECQAGDEVKGE
jgi:hypothetical protein